MEEYPLINIADHPIVELGAARALLDTRSPFSIGRGVKISARDLPHLV